MTEDRRQRTEGRRRSAEGTVIIGLPSSVVCRRPFVVLALLSLVFATGCRNRALEQAQRETREARATVEKLKFSVNQAAEEIATAKEELSSVRRNRDDLQKQVDQLMRERDQASTFAQQAQEAISKLTTQESGQKSVTAALEKQITELKTLVEDQQKLIEQLKGAAGQPVTATAQATEKPPTPDPNEKPCPCAFRHRRRREPVPPSVDEATSFFVFNLGLGIYSVRCPGCGPASLHAG